MALLNQIIAIEKGTKSRVYSELTEVHKTNQKGKELFNGFSKTYRTINEDGETLPPESKRVQWRSDDVLHTTERLMSELFNVTARKDWTNQVATGTVEIDDKVILENVPVSYLLFLEKQLSDINAIIDTLPVLDPSEDWKYDGHSGLYKTAVVSTHRTKKEQRGIVLYDATENHPAQTQLITEDRLVGYWDTVKQSGAIPAPEKAELKDRVTKLQNAVKQAREFANSMEEVCSPDVGGPIFNYLFEEKE